MNVETANRLQNLRKKNGYSQEELAEKIGISRQAVSKWERAEASPDTDNLILLAKLYGVTLDELLNTESVPMPNSEGISLSKDYYTSVSDDGEIYPEGHPKHIPSNEGEVMPSGAANSANKTENAEKTANGTENNEPKPTVGDVVKNVAGAIGDAIDTTAASIREGKANAPQDGSDNGKSYADAFEKNFKDFGERMKTFGENLEKDMSRMGKDIEKSVENAFDENFEKNMNQMGKDIEASVKKTFSEENEHISRHEERRQQHEQRHENHEEKFPATLLDKLFPLLVTGAFLYTVFCAKWAVKFSWFVFLTIPIYYILSDNFKKLKYHKTDPLHALKSFLDGSLPILIVFVYLALGLTAGAWVSTLFLFGLIPLYYIFSHNFFNWLDGKKSFGKAVKNFFDGSVPILVVMIFFLSFYFGFKPQIVLIFAVIPFYYIISSHFAKK